MIRVLFAGISGGTAIGIGFILLIYAFVALLPAISAFVYAWHYHKQPTTNGRWYKQPKLLVAMGVIYIVAIPLFLLGGDVHNALQSTGRYKEPIYFAYVKGHKLGSITVSAGTDGPGEKIYLHYPSTDGSYSIEQADYVDDLESNFLSECIGGVTCNFLTETPAGKAYYYAELGKTWIKTGSGFIMIHQYPGPTEKTAQNHADIARSLQPVSSVELLKTLIFKVEDR